MNCFICKGDLNNKLNNYVANLEHCVVIIKNVPSLTCCQCGEVYYNDDVSEKLEKIVDNLEKFVEEVVIVEYNKMIA